MRLQIVTPDKAVLDQEVEEVYAPGTNGEFGILPQHITFLTSLDVGVLRYRAGGKDDFVAISGGLTEVLDDSITVLADAAERRHEIDVDRARIAEEAANREMEELLPGTPEHDDCLASLKRAQNRAAVAAIS
jgi:F-type H+-transporting ATPase subunit epsilon